jgi:hypothetical protein
MAVMTFLWLAAAFRGTVRDAPRVGPALTGLVTFLVFMNLAAFLGFMSSYADTLSGAWGRIPPRVYLERTYAPFGAVQYLNRLELEGKVLFLGEMKGFYSMFPREVSTFDVPNRLVELIRQGEGSDGAAKNLLEHGFSHILFNPGEFERLAAKSPFLRLGPDQRAILDTFLAERTMTVFSGGGIRVLEIAHE